jgi:ketosteroid isomerase-like protein
MKRFGISLALLGLCSTCFAGDLVTEFKKFMSKEGPKVMAAFRNKDISYFEKTSTDDFTYTEYKGKPMGKKDALSGMQMMFNMMDKIESSFKMLRVRAKGDAMLVDMDSYMTGTTKRTGKEKAHVMKAITYETETWVKVNGKWMLKSITERKKGVMTMDGKPFNPGG